MRGLVAAVFASLGATSSYAADMPVKAPPPAAPVAVFTWTGCYLGGHVGGGFGSKDWANPSGFQLSDSEPLFSGTTLSLHQHVAGLVGGGQTGCRVQLAPNWVAGIESDFSTTHVVATTDMILNGSGIPARFRSETGWLATATANLGFSDGRLLLYAKAGAAWARDNYDIEAKPGFPLRPTDFEARETRTGWTVGAGVEYAFWNNLSARLEYDFCDFGSRSVHFLNQIASPASPLPLRAPDLARRRGQ